MARGLLCLELLGADRARISEFRQLLDPIKVGVRHSGWCLSGFDARSRLRLPDLVQLRLDVSGNDERGERDDERRNQQPEHDPPVKRRASERCLLRALKSLHPVVERDVQRNDHQGAREYGQQREGRVVPKAAHVSGPAEVHDLPVHLIPPVDVVDADRDHRQGRHRDGVPDLRRMTRVADLDGLGHDSWPPDGHVLGSRLNLSAGPRRRASLRLDLSS
jgi:hypothetical protein